MPEGMLYGNDLGFMRDLSRYLGETVTIFTTSGGESGSGFTGVLVAVNEDFVRLVTAIGTAPECSLGNNCDFLDDCRDFRGSDRFGRRHHRRRGSFRDLGSVVDIPICRIASIVHNTL